MRGPSLCSRCCCAVLSLLVVHVCLFALVVFTEKKKSLAKRKHQYHIAILHRDSHNTKYSPVWVR